MCCCMHAYNYIKGSNLQCYIRSRPNFIKGLDDYLGAWHCQINGAGRIKVL